MQRIVLIEQRLQKAFAPKELQVLDDSEQHRGHVGSQGGAGHYTVIIVAECFKGLSRVVMHQRIYAALGDLIPGEIHALKIKAADC